MLGRGGGPADNTTQRGGLAGGGGTASVLPTRAKNNTSGPGVKQPVVKTEPVKSALLRCHETLCKHACGMLSGTRMRPNIASKHDHDHGYRSDFFDWM